MAKTYHVAKTGNDRNKGTKEAPFLTMQRQENTSSSKVLSGSPTGKKWKELFGKRKFPINCLEISILMTPICMATGW